MNEKIVKFKAKDGIILDGIVRKNDENNDKILIQVHGMTSNCFKERDTIIAEEIEDLKIDTLRFNNRGSEIARYITDGIQKREGGTAFENFEECYYDIVAAIEYAISLGYKIIFLQGHSLGCTKIVYTYERLLQEKNELINKINGIILLSMVDIVDSTKQCKNTKFFKLAEEKEKRNELLDWMPEESFIHPICVKTYLQYVKYNKNFDFVKFDNTEYEYQVLNNIRCPLFMRWGNVNEMINKDAKELSNIVNNKIKNPQKNISYIDGADHGYHGREKKLAQEIRKFLYELK